jgi:hypothetical protein
MNKDASYHALLQACNQDGCPLCRLTYESMRRYLDSWKYEMFTDVEMRNELRRTQGFCHTHTWQLARMGAALPLAQAYRDVLSDTIERLKGAGDSIPPPSGSRLRRFFEAKQDHAVCPACTQKEKIAARYAHTLHKALLIDEFYQQFLHSQGLCLDHFRLTCELKVSDTSGNWLTLLRKAQLAQLEQLDAQLGEMIRKHDYRFKDEEQGDEMTSWKRAAGLVAGEEE